MAHRPPVEEEGGAPERHTEDAHRPDGNVGERDVPCAQPVDEEWSHSYEELDQKEGVVRRRVQSLVCPRS